MSNWQKKHDELHGRLVRQSNLLLAALIFAAMVSVTGTVILTNQMHKKEAQKHFNQFMQIKQNSLHQHQK